jgi:hypothetical protein
MRNKALKITLVFPAVILLLPAIAMLFSSEVKWSVFDFIIAAILLYGASFGIYLITSIKTKWLRIGLMSVIFMLFILVWGELAVGIFGTPFAGN